MSVFICLSLFVINVSAYVAPYSLSDATSTVAEAVNSYGEALETYRYYIQVPNGENGPAGVRSGEKVPSWLNEFSDADQDGKLDFGPGIFWWEANAKDCPVPQAWTGYRVEKGDADGIYYADVPVNVTAVNWNNGIYTGDDPSAEIYSAGGMTGTVGTECYLPGENPLYPGGLADFNNMICILDPDRPSGVPEYHDAYSTQWYYYYGEGHYGVYDPSGAEINDAFIENKCVNPDHDHTRSMDICGDADVDNVVTVADTTKIQQHLVSLAVLPFSEKTADVDDDNLVSIVDATIIQQYLAKINVKYPVGELIS